MPTVIVEDGSKVTGANSYISVADARTLLDEYLDPEVAWDAVEDADRERAVISATRKIDSRFDESWRGKRSWSDQALSWPRTDAYDQDDWLWDSDEIPTELKHAVALLAYEIATGAETSTTRSEGGDVEELSIGRGAVELTFGEGSRSRDVPLWEERVQVLLDGGSASGNSILDVSLAW